jgi:glycosyltransferase involved in cell wall biosynthesis
MKFGVITTSYPRFAGDAAGGFVAGHARALRALGHEVEVIAAGAAQPTAATGPRVPARADDEPRVVRVGASPLFYRGGAPDALESSPLGAGIAAAAFTARLIAAVAPRARHWDAIIAHWLAPSAIAALPSRRPVLAIAHGGDVYTLRRLGLLGPVLRALRRRGARLAFVSEALREVARSAVPALSGWLDAAIVQPMGLELARFARLERAPSDPPIALVAARLVPVKGVDLAIAAMPHVQRAARLVIAGDGPERARLAAQPGRHELIGEVSAERRDALLSAASVVVVPSRALPSGRTEGMPMIALEALAAGVPVVGSAVGGLRDLPGVLTAAPGDPRALAQAIDRALARPPPPDALRAAVAGLDWREVAVRLLRE